MCTYVHMYIECWWKDIGIWIHTDPLNFTVSICLNREPCMHVCMHAGCQLDSVASRIFVVELFPDAVSDETSQAILILPLCDDQVGPLWHAGPGTQFQDSLQLLECHTNMAHMLTGLQKGEHVWSSMPTNTSHTVYMTDDETNTKPSDCTSIKHVRKPKREHNMHIYIYVYVIVTIQNCVYAPHEYLNACVHTRPCHSTLLSMAPTIPMGWPQEPLLHAIWRLWCLRAGPMTHVYAYTHIHI